MKMYILKHENDEAETVFITKNQETAFDIFEASTLPLCWCELEFSDLESLEIVDLCLDDWIDMNDYKFPAKKTANGYEYQILTTTEFLNILQKAPSIIQKLVYLEYWKEYPLMTQELVVELYEEFQGFELVE